MTIDPYTRFVNETQEAEGLCLNGQLQESADALRELASYLEAQAELMEAV